jgi:hypothetical protein
MNLTDRTINPLTTLRAVFQQQENASLPYVIDYTAMLNGDTITASTWSCRDAGVTITPSNTTLTAAATISGQAGEYTIVNKITTAAGMVDERVLVLTIRANDNGPLGEYVYGTGRSGRRL